MSVIQRVVKATTRKGKKVLLAREPQVIEGPKRTLIFQGRKCGQTLQSVLKDIYDLKKPDALNLTKKNDVTIFENSTPVENFCRKHECSLFIMGNHNKKRPNNLVIGRVFDNSLLDMVELGVDDYEGFRKFEESVPLGIKPCLVFAGPKWDENAEMQTLQNILVDLFHREKAKAIRLQGIEHVINFTATPEGKILFRSYKVLLKKSGQKCPRVEVIEIGPRLKLTLRRSKLASEDLMKQATRKPKVLKITKKKNVSVDGLGTTRGRIHVGKQQLAKLQTRKMKGLRKSMEEKKAARLLKRKSTGNTPDEGEIKKIKVYN